MAIPKITGAQRDFSAGELDEDMKRADDNPLMKAGARQMENWRILNSHAVQNRPGRRALFPEDCRPEPILISPGNEFTLAFTAAGHLRVYNTAGSQVFDQSGFLWTKLNWQFVSFAVSKFGLAVYIAFPGQQPQVLSWDGASTWSVAPYAETVTVNGQKRTIFYRISPPNITLLPGGTTGSVSIQFSAPVLDPGMVGTRIRYDSRQLLITAVTDSENGTATVEETLSGDQQVNFSAGATGTFTVGDVVEGNQSGAQGIVVGVASNDVIVQLLFVNGTNIPFSIGEFITGPAGFAITTSVSFPGNVHAISVWDQEVMNAFRGWPSSVSIDQNRLIFTNFPAVPSGIAWSAIGLPTDLYVAALPANAMFELAPGNTQVYFVVPGPESGEFIFGDNKVYYIPITVTNPLVPGSVAFNVLSSDGASNVQPRAVEEIIFYVMAGARRVKAVIAPGAYYRPFNTVDVSENHNHLFDGIIAIAAPTADSTFPERYCYALGATSLAVGKYQVKDGQLQGAIGWVPWITSGSVGWISALSGDVIIQTTYAPNGAAPVGVVEIFDDTQYLDGALLVNSLPAPFAPPGGKGPLYVFPGPNSSVTLMDQVTRMMGTYLVDANGFIIPQNKGGENLAAASLVAGQPWTATLEPFVPDASPGQNVDQRMNKRRVSRMVVYVSNSTGFLMARLFSGPITRTSPPLGTIMNNRRVTAWNQDDDPTKPPPLREEAKRMRPLGRAYDPRVAIIKDTPGPILVHEIGLQSTV